MGSKRYRDREWLEKQVRTGKFPEEIADSCGVTAETIERWIDRHSITPYQDEEWLESQFSNYIPPQTIADWCCVTEQTVKRWARRFDLEHPGLPPIEFLQSYLEERFNGVGDEAEVPKRHQINEIDKRFKPPRSRIAKAVNTDRAYVYHELTPGPNRSLSDSVPASLRRKVLARDDYECVRCGSSNMEENLHIHHIIQGESTEENLASLCIDCHLDAHGGNFSGTIVYDTREEFWEEWIETA